MSKFEDGYEVAVRELVDVKINHLHSLADEIPNARLAKVVNLMDALQESLGAEKLAPKKPSISKKSLLCEGIGLVKAPTKTPARRWSA